MSGRVQAELLQKEWLAGGIVSFLLHAPAVAKRAAAGQFVDLYLADPSRLLPRPVSICFSDAEAGTLRLVFRVTREGSGTDALSKLEPGDVVELLGPLGNGFPIEEALGRVLLLGGGIGIPPMLKTAEEITKKGGATLAVGLGFQRETFLLDEFGAYAAPLVATEDGSAGTKGTVLDAVREAGIKADLIFACGPRPMLRAVANFAKEQNARCYVSMEERMACGIGACLACVCETRGVHAHTNVHNARVCKDGPVFAAEEIVL